MMTLFSFLLCSTQEVQAQSPNRPLMSASQNPITTQAQPSPTPIISQASSNPFGGFQNPNLAQTGFGNRQTGSQSSIPLISNLNNLQSSFDSQLDNNLAQQDGFRSSLDQNLNPQDLSRSRDDLRIVQLISRLRFMSGLPLSPIQANTQELFVSLTSPPPNTQTYSSFSSWRTISIELLQILKSIELVWKHSQFSSLSPDQRSLLENKVRVLTLTPHQMELEREFMVSDSHSTSSSHSLGFFSFFPFFKIK